MTLSGSRLVADVINKDEVIGGGISSIRTSVLIKKEKFGHSQAHREKAKAMKAEIYKPRIATCCQQTVRS